MKPRKEELKKVPEPHKHEGKSRFQIVKLEERIAPGHVFRSNCHGKNISSRCDV